MSAGERERAFGFDLIVPKLRNLFEGSEVTVGPGFRLLGGRDGAGSRLPYPSSAARLTVGGTDVTVPVPREPSAPDKGLAPIYEVAGRHYVMPFVRLLRPRAEEPEDVAVEYCSLSDWLHDALCVWTFRAARPRPARRTEGTEPGRERTVSTAADHLQQENDPGHRLKLVGRLIRYALFGARREQFLGGLWLSVAPAWLRPVDGESELARATARSLVISAGLKEREGRGRIPRTGLRARAYRIDPTGRDRGIDPVHTPESTDIRLTGRLGLGVALEDRKLVAPGGVALSASTVRIPFAGYDDPRRLLMAANAQTHAVPLTASEPELPRVRVDGTGTEPPGANLRVGYLAWRGLNHEDAWVLSESAAARLTARETVTQYVAIGALEQDPEEVAKSGTAASRSRPLLRRVIAPTLISDDLGTVGPMLAAGREQVLLRPEPGDYPLIDGEVEFHDPPWNLIGDPPDGYEFGTDVVGAYRAVYRFTIRRERPLRVGDKLANRHGHKGVVGAILPDDEMPRWRGRPLEALIDPISVLNRSNFGQLYESLAGAESDGEVLKPPGPTTRAWAERLRADPNGRNVIEQPAKGDWLSGSVMAVAGVQFVMRMPHHAGDRLSGHPVPKDGPAGMRRRQQRFGEMDSWALWAHDRRTEGARPAGGPLTPAANSLLRILSVAGFPATEGDDQTVTLSAERLDQESPKKSGWFKLTDRSFEALRTKKLPERVLSKLKTLKDKRVRQIDFENELTKLLSAAEKGKFFDPILNQAQKAHEFALKTPSSSRKEPLISLPKLYENLDRLPEDETTVICFDPPLRDGTVPGGGPTAPTQQNGGGEVRWVRLLPARDRPPRWSPEGESPHALTVALRAVIRHAHDREKERRAKNADKEQKETRALVRAVRELRKEARATAVGLGATGLRSGKRSLLRRAVLGARVAHSGRATISPGPGLALDEVELPRALAAALVGADAADADLDATVKDRMFWIKRDPVLHRWGLLPVRARVGDGETIRLPASLLKPMGADFDGDTVAVFARIPGGPPAEQIPDTGRVPALSWHPVLREDGEMFVPTKQYLFGLHLVLTNEEQRSAFVAHLARAGAPEWPDRMSAKEALSAWCRAAAERPAEARGSWWALLEEHALNGLARCPDMGLGVFDAAVYSTLPAVTCGAAKKDLYSGDTPPVIGLINGASLDAFSASVGPNDPVGDPIQNVMVQAKESVGQFGGALRRLLYSLDAITPDLVQDAQCLTELATQKALSVKGVKGDKDPFTFTAYNKELNELLNGEGTGDRLARLLVGPEPDSREPGYQDKMKKWEGRIEQLKDVWNRLRAQMKPNERPPWLKWLRSPFDLENIVKDDTEPLRLPLNDPRLRGWRT